MKKKRKKGEMEGKRERRGENYRYWGKNGKWGPIKSELYTYTYGKTPVAPSPPFDVLPKIALRKM